MPYLLDLLYSQFFVSIPTPTASFADQTVIVTGSNTGLGLEAARHLARLNTAKIILAVRTISKGEAAAAEIVKTCNIPASRVEVWQLDMGNKDSIKAFAERAATLPRLDAAILNAGVFTFKRAEIDGMEAHLAVNVIGAVLLQLLLLPTLKASAARTGSRGRLTLVGSDMMYFVKPSDFQTPGDILPYLNAPGNRPEDQYYAYSKWLVFCATRRIAALNPVSEKSNVIVSVQTPGACQSDLFREDVGRFKQLMMSVMFAVFARTTDVGGRTLVDAVRPDLPVKAHGKFLMDCQVQQNKYTVADDNKVSTEVDGKWTRELFARLEEIIPGVTKQ